MATECAKAKNAGAVTAATGPVVPLADISGRRRTPGPYCGTTTVYVGQEYLPGSVDAFPA